MALDELEKKDKKLSEYIQTIIQILTTPKEYFDNLQNKKYNYPVYSILCIFCNILISIFNYNESILKAIFCVFISILLSVGICLLSSIYADIDKKNRVGYIIVNSLICISFMMLQSILIWVYQYSEKYVWYALSILVIVVLQVWLFIYLPARLAKNKKSFLLNITTVFFFVGFFNYTINGIINLATIKQYNKENCIVVLQDPVFTEEINELGNIIKTMSYYLQVLESLARYTADDIIDGNNRNVILLQCEKLLSSKDSLRKAYDDVTYKKTKDLYVPLLKITDNTQRIEDLFFLMIECNRNLKDFDTDEYKKIANDLQKQFNEINEFEIHLKNRIKEANTRLEELKNKYNAENEILNESDKKELEKQIILIRKERNEIFSMIEYFTNIQSLKMDENNEIKKQLEKDRIDLNIINENTKLYSEIIFLLQEANDSVGKELQKYKSLLNFYKIRRILSMFMI